MVDPITLTGLALAGLAGTAASGLTSSSAPSAAPAAPPAAAPPAQNPTGTAQKAPVQQQSFIGAAATPSSQSGQKTLLGQ